MLQIYEKIAEKIAHKRVFLTFLSLILIQTFALAQNDSKITIQQKNITVIDALKTVEKQSKMSINYSDSELTGKVIAQLNLQNASLETALDTILKGTGFSFQIQGNYIIIAEKKPVVAQILKNIKGKVTDESGEPLIGVNISVDGSSTGTITDFDGNFTIKAAEKSILKVSYIGYAAQIIPVSKKDFYPVVMKQDTEVLDEVVVTALGIKRAEKALSYNVQQVKGDALTTVKDANFVNSLNGKIAGVSINKSASGVGGATRVVMRGAKSIEGDNNALYVVDGIPLFNTNMGNTDSGIMGEGKAGTEGIADFNPEDIESLSVLSGPSAAALYGSSAANGVILITTKKGKSHKLNFRIGVKQGMYTRGIPEYDKLGVNQWMEAMRSGMQSYWEKDGGVTPQQAFEASKTVNDDIVFSPIFDKNGAAMFDENGKFVAKVKPGYNDLDWLKALERTGFGQRLHMELRSFFVGKCQYPPRKEVRIRNRF